MKKLILFITLAFATVAQGQTIPNFSLPDVSSQKEVSLNDFSNKKAVVVIFTSNVCPYSVYYEGRITQLIAEFGPKNVQFLLINSHSDGKENASEMKNKIETWGLDVPYLADKEQKALNLFKAKKSPEAFILKPNGSSFTIFYNGAIDNNPQVASDVKKHYLKDNLNALLSGDKAIPGDRPIGCMIR